MKKLISLSLLVYTSLFADAELDAIRAQLEQQKLITQKLEAKLNQLEQKSQTQSKKIAKIETKSIEAQPNTNQSASFSQNAYLPDMAFILNMSALDRNVKNSDYTHYAIPGFINDVNNALPFNKKDGFNFNYAEVALRSTVDPYFDAFAIFHISTTGLEIEEAFVNTRALPYGLQVKAGKFKSAFGRINEKHQHVWQFDSQPIIYESLFGPDAISDSGIQAQWVAPTDTYIMAGVEAFSGSNTRSFGANTQNKHLYVGYLKSSIDIGEDMSVLEGASIAHGDNYENNTTNPTNIYGLDLTLREQLGSYSSLIWQSEFLQRDKELTTRTDKQSGLYSELIYQYNNNWSTGVRYDTILKNDTDLSTSYSNIDTSNLDRYTAKIDYHPFPMSRLRLQYTYDRTKVIAGERKNTNEIMMSLNIAAGAHGAHNY
jgi:hypothetical protein